MTTKLYQFVGTKPFDKLYPTPRRNMTIRRELAAMIALFILVTGVLTSVRGGYRIQPDEQVVTYDSSGHIELHDNALFFDLPWAAYDVLPTDETINYTYVTTTGNEIKVKIDDTSIVTDQLVHWSDPTVEDALVALNGFGLGRPADLIDAHSDQVIQEVFNYAFEEALLDKKFGDDLDYTVAQTQTAVDTIVARKYHSEIAAAKAACGTNCTSPLKDVDLRYRFDCTTVTLETSDSDAQAYAKQLEALTSDAVDITVPSSFSIYLPTAEPCGEVATSAPSGRTDMVSASLFALAN